MIGRVANRNRSVVVGRLGLPVVLDVDVLRLRLFRPNFLSTEKLERVLDLRRPGSVPRVVECRYCSDLAREVCPRIVRPGSSSCRCCPAISQPVVFPLKSVRQEPLALPRSRRSCRYWNRGFSRNPVLASTSPVTFRSKYSFVAQVPALLHAAAVVRYRKAGVPAALHREDVYGEIEDRYAEYVRRRVPDDRLVVGDDLRFAQSEIVVQVVRVVAGGVGALLDFEGPVGVEPDEFAVEEPLLVLGAALPDLSLARLHVVLHAIAHHDVHVVLQPRVGVGLGIDVRRRGQEVRGQQLVIGVISQPAGRQLDVAVLQLGASDHLQRAVAEYVFDGVCVVIDHRQIRRIGRGAGPALAPSAAGRDLREGRPGEVQACQRQKDRQEPHRQEPHARHSHRKQPHGQEPRGTGQPAFIFTFIIKNMNNMPRSYEIVLTRCRGTVLNSMTRDRSFASLRNLKRTGSRRKRFVSSPVRAEARWIKEFPKKIY